VVNSGPYAELAGKTAFSAREATVNMLRESGDLDGEPWKINRPVKYYERGEKPLEIIATRQWYITNGGRSDKLKAALIERGEQLQWVPEYMRHRYEDWVNGLNGDWLISRQRFFGVPFPVWYPLDAEGEPDYDHPIMAAEASLPVDPQNDVPPGFTAEQRGEPGGFTGDPDVMDTWATSSLTPQIAGKWEDDPELFALTFPMDMAPQAHDIIRTWLFSRVLRSHLEHHSVPWRLTALSGFVVDPDRKKMSKSKGNVVVPNEILEKYGSDAVRWRAAMASPGSDSPFDEGQMKVGRRLAMKVLNAAKYVLGLGEGAPGADAVTEPIDLALLAELRAVVSGATEAFDEFNYTEALMGVERFFWMFCDDYLEVVKERAYGSAGEGPAGSARAALRLALDVLLRLFAPFLPFVTEEVWSWLDKPQSIHLSAWPDVDELPGSADPVLLDHVSAALIGIRGAKSEAKVSMKTEIAQAAISGPPEALAGLKLVESDLRAVGRITGPIQWSEAETVAVAATLAAG
jgi:valyl-tRNA synthetase